MPCHVNSANGARISTDLVLDSARYLLIVLAAPLSYDECADLNIR